MDRPELSSIMTAEKPRITHVWRPTLTKPYSWKIVPPPPECADQARNDPTAQRGGPAMAAVAPTSVASASATTVAAMRTSSAYC
jgi:hypothetical protein